jgi:4-methylaminobutanoate oxidase (formaldehyde-forming)
MINLGYAPVRASRITYVGELGWELYIATEFAAGVYEAIVSAGVPLGLAHAGYHAVNSLRMEKGYRHWGHDISPDESPLEAGLGFAVAWDKSGGFIGRDALLSQRETGRRKRLAQFRLHDSDRLIYHNEPIWRDGLIVGRITSGMYGHTIGAPLGMGYVESPEAVTEADYVLSGTYEIEVACERVPADVSLRPFYDPTSDRIRT